MAQLQRFVVGQTEQSFFALLASLLRFMRKEILDKRIFDTLGNKLVDVAWAQTNNRLGLLRNMVTANGMFQEFKTDLFLASVPAMLDSPYRWIINITQKG